MQNTKDTTSLAHQGATMSDTSKPTELQLIVTIDRHADGTFSLVVDDPDRRESVLQEHERATDLLNDLRHDVERRCRAVFDI